MGLTSLIACSSERPDGQSEEKRSGTLSLALQATSKLGNTYRLRNAFFEIRDNKTGNTVAFISSEDAPPSAPTISSPLLPIGNYTVTLFQGWQLERVSSGGGNSGTGGSVSVPPGTGGDVAVPPPKEGPQVPKKPIEPDPGEVGGESGLGGDSGSGGSSSTGGSGIPSGGSFPTEGGAFPEGGTSVGGTSVGGSFPTAGSGGTGNAGPVDDARLISDAVQFFSIFGGDTAFVTYFFKVGGEDPIPFDKGKLQVNIEVDDTEACIPPDGATNPERVLMETNTVAVSQVQLTQVFKALSTNGGHSGDPLRVYQEIWDSYASADQALLPDAIHCGDETTNGFPSLNGFPIVCNRAEAAHVSDMESFFPTAFVNRLDLAPANGAHCGQQRMIFANNNGPGSFGFGRAFMILEAQIPNPHPELGIQGCAPLAQFWLDQNGIDSPVERGQRLAQAFLFGGAPGLEEFGPFYTAENLTVGSGQIRTNVFDSSPWTLREFKLALDGSAIKAVPFPVAESPHGSLWNELSGEPAGEACRANFLDALDGLITDDLSDMSFIVDSACKNSESQNDFFTEDYNANMSDGFRQQIDEKLKTIGSTLTSFDIANRARFAGSCMGCHQEASGSSLGNGISAPFSFDFPQVTESIETCKDGGSCFQKSQGLKQVFLPGRLATLGQLVPVVGNPCDGGGGGNGTGGSVGSGGSFGMGGSIIVGGSTGSAGKPGMDPGFPIPGGEPAPVIEIELASADAPVAELVEQEEEIRDEYGDVTISGKSAKSTH
jgi:hypothetical protein